MQLINSITAVSLHICMRALTIKRFQTYFSKNSALM